MFVVAIMPMMMVVSQRGARGKTAHNERERDCNRELTDLD
jgi:hypothetical protein